eukprot:752422-Hanusia_phi.AAC.9
MIPDRAYGCNKGLERGGYTGGVLNGPFCGSSRGVRCPDETLYILTVKRSRSPAGRLTVAASNASLVPIVQRRSVVKSYRTTLNSPTDHHMGDLELSQL